MVSELIRISLNNDLVIDDRHHASMMSMQRLQHHPGNAVAHYFDRYALEVRCRSQMDAATVFYYVTKPPLANIDTPRPRPLALWLRAESLVRLRAGERARTLC